MEPRITRRAAMQTLAATTASVACARLLASSSAPVHELVAVAKKVHPKQHWSYTEFNEFLRVLPEEGLESMGTALELSGDFDPRQRDTAITAIKKQFLWSASHLIAYVFKDHEKIPYHETVEWVAVKLDVDAWIVKTQPTLVVERAIIEKLFVDVWDNLSPLQRQKFLKELGAGDSIKNAAAIASLSGAGALAALSLTVHLAGFAFYTTMSSFICAAAGFLEVTLPFAVYTASSSIVAFLTGPVGWALIVIAAAASIALLCDANVKKTAAAICQLHMLKVAALQAANVADKDVFDVVGDPLRRQFIGRWRVCGKRETIEYLFAGEGSFLATCYSVPNRQGDKPKLLWKGKGKWYIDDRLLTVQWTHVEGKWLWSANKRMLYDKREVVSVEPLRIELAGNAVLERL